jgi:hypothetical protein
MIGTRGVLQGGAEYVAESTLGAVAASPHHHPHEPHAHPHASPPERARKAPKAAKRTGTRR